MLKLIIHFVLTECRPILLLYLAYKSYLQDTILYSVTHTFLTWNNDKLKHVSNSTMSTEDLGDYMDCLRDDVSDSIFAYNATYNPRCAVIPHSMHMMDLVMNSAALLIGVLFVAVLVCMVPMSGAKTFGDGRYISFTVGVRKSRGFRAMAVLETAFVVYVVARNVHTLWLEFKEGYHHKVVEFLEDYGTDALVLVYSSVALFQTSEPCFAWDSEEFKQLQFNRGWGAVFSETNDAFITALELALYKASYNSIGDLDAMRDKQTSLRTVMQVCAPAMDSDFEMVNEYERNSFAKVPADSRQVNPAHPYAPGSHTEEGESETGSEGLLC